MPTIYTAAEFNNQDLYKIYDAIVNGGGGFDGSVDENYIAKGVSPSGDELGNSQLYDNGTQIGINTTSINASVFMAIKDPGDTFENATLVITDFDDNNMFVFNNNGGLSINSNFVPVAALDLLAINDLYAITATGGFSGFGTATPTAQMHVVATGGVATKIVGASTYNTLDVTGGGSTNSTYTAIFRNASSAISLQIKDDGSVWNAGKGNSTTNTAFGLGALLNRNIANGSVAIGDLALRDLTDGDNNTAVGSGALLKITTGTQNVGIGVGAYANATIGNYATAVGYNSLRVATGDYNTGLGHRTLYTLSTGTDNTAVGATSLFSLTTGGTTTAIGTNSGFSNQTGNRNIFLGYSSGYYETGSNKFFVDTYARADEQAGRNSALLYGKTSTTVSSQFLTINGTIYLKDTNSGNYFSVVITSGAWVLTDTGSSNAPS